MDDFEDASKRHLADAEMLFAQAPQRLANASHLFGISAECSLKSIAKKLKPNTRFGGRTGHIPDLFAELMNVAPAIGTNADLVTKIAAIEPYFAHWQVAQRYVSQTNFLAGTVALEKAGANDAHLLMTNCLQGLI